MISTWRFPRIDHSPHQHYCRWLWRSFPRTSPTGFCGWIAMPWWPTAPFPSRISCRPTWSRKMPISWWPRTATAGCWWCGMVRMVLCHGKSWPPTPTFIISSLGDVRHQLWRFLAAWGWSGIAIPERRHEQRLAFLKLEGVISCYVLVIL